MKEILVCERCNATYTIYDKYNYHKDRCNGAPQNNLTMVDLTKNHFDNDQVAANGKLFEICSKMLVILMQMIA